MIKLHIRKGDNVIVLTGRDKGKTGKVQKVLVEEQRAIVEGINMVSKSQNPKSGKATRVSIKQEGKNVIRIAKKSGEEIK